MEYDGREYYLTQLTQPIPIRDCSFVYVGTVSGHITTHVYEHRGRLYAARTLPNRQYRMLYRMHIKTSGRAHGDDIQEDRGSRG